MKKSYVLYNTSECNDSLRDRYLYCVVANSASEAREKLQKHFNEQVINELRPGETIEDIADDAEYYSEMLSGYSIEVAEHGYSIGGFTKVE